MDFGPGWKVEHVLRLSGPAGVVEIVSDTGEPILDEDVAREKIAAALGSARRAAAARARRRERRKQDGSR